MFKLWKKATRAPSHIEIAARQLVESREQLLEQEKAYEHAQAIVPMLKKRISRLESLLADEKE